MTDSIKNTRYNVDEKSLRASLTGTPVEPWIDALIDAVNSREEKLHQGLLPKWQAALDALPDLPITHIDLDHHTGVAALTDADIAADEMAAQQLDVETATPTALDSESKSVSENGSVGVISGSINGSENENESESESESESENENENENGDTPNSIDNAAILAYSLKQLMPWRKGPYRIGPITIDTEWHSDWKWNRVLPHIQSLEGRTVLDVGCGSGYHMWRMRSQGAATVIGVDPGLLFLMQFKALQHYINDPAVCMLPLTMETLPAKMHSFDTVFSMGVLYHRKDPHAHLRELLHSMKPGGEIVLETLVALGEKEHEMKIESRYARMKNIWSLPSVPLLAKWMHDAGFNNIRCVSVDITSQLEQRTTQWMPYESLIDSLDSDDRSKTVEGLPRPRRAVMIANST